ncbi:MAG TPA: hypothetical protein VMU16_07430 [Candidatus Binataceae bacterium]|nr:hypothetical protein [Candidatus Binataceae bacterium]
MLAYKAIATDATKKGPRWIAVIPVILMFMSLTLAGCAMSSGDDTTADDAADDVGEPLPPPVASVGITYKRPGDIMTRATVTKYFGAEVIATTKRDSTHTETVMRFDGGVPIWEFKSEEGALGEITGVGATKFALPKVQYGKVPADFTQILPEEGPPEPLDRGSYYVFQIERRSGSTSYQAVKVLADGSLQAYNAQPRAGSSYLLCCNVSYDFPEPVVLPEPTEQASDQGGDQPPSDDNGGGSPDAPDSGAPPPP